MKNKMVIFAVAAIVVVGAGAYLLMNKGGAGSELSALQALPGMQNYVCRYNDPDLCRFMLGWKEVKEYSVKSTTTMKNELPSENNFEMDGDRTRMVAMSGDKEVMATVSIGEVSYMKDMMDGKWWKIEPQKNTVSPSVMPEDFERDLDFADKMDMPEDKTTYVKMGKEACGTMQCFKYEVVDPENKEWREFIWFDDSAYQLYKTRSESTGTDAMVSEMVMTYGAVTITEPSPVKEGSMMDAAMKNSGLSEKDIQDYQKQMDEAQKQYQNMPQDFGTYNDSPPMENIEVPAEEPYTDPGTGEQ